jgi:spore cortex formation protein SpoVR/YcgB (stage V sporulation)
MLASLKKGERDMSSTKLLFQSADWNPEDLAQADGEVRRIAEDELRLDTYPNQYEIITSEQMLDAYASVGLPVMYSHWSFGRLRAMEERNYQKGKNGLAYELVINSNPCVNYLMETNTSVLQTLVIAHAGYGHNSFFKNNYAFKEGVDASFILDYLAYAKKYLAECEQKYGAKIVENVLDAAHALDMWGIDYGRRATPLTEKETEEKEIKKRERDAAERLLEWEVMMPQSHPEQAVGDQEIRWPKEPEENILYFVEKNAPNMPTWKREVIRIVRRISQYLHPQGASKVMNEGWATFTHYYIMRRLHEKGLLSDGQFLEFIKSHTGVVNSHGITNNINPYQLGFNMFTDMRRICENPTKAEKKEYDFAGEQDWVSVLQNAAYNYRDESFIRQFLSAKVVADMRMARMKRVDGKYVEFTHVAVEETYKDVRKALADRYLEMMRVPDVRVYKVNRWGDRKLILKRYDDDRGKLIGEVDSVLRHLAYLWSYDVELIADGQSRTAITSM